MRSVTRHRMSRSWPVGRTILPLVCALLFLSTCANPFYDRVKEVVDSAKGPRVAISAGAGAIATGGTYDFGRVELGKTTSVTFTITNRSGTDVLLFSGVGAFIFSGTDAADFSLTSLPPTLAIPGGGSATFSLGFTPSSYGARTAMLSIASNDPAGMYAMGITGLCSVSTPIFSPGPGTYSADQDVTISCSPTPDNIYFTTDGSTPTTASSPYSGPVPVHGDGLTLTIKAIAVKAGAPDSSVASGTYTINTSVVSTPSFAPPPGAYFSDQSVSITSDAGATIHYTTDGSTPTAASATTLPVLVTGNGTTTIKAIAIKAGMTDSPVATAVYNITYPPAGNPFFSPSGGQIPVSVSSLAVQITAPSAGTSIAYTTDGSNPIVTGGTVTNGTSAASPATVILTANTLVNAVAYGPGYTTSPVNSQQFNLEPMAPVFGPPGGTYPSAQSVTISSSTPGAQIRYTTNGTVPTSGNGTLVSSPATVPVSATMTLTARAEKPGWSATVPLAATYTIQITLPPTFTPTGGHIGSQGTIQLIPQTIGSDIAYTLDGSIPTVSGGTITHGTLYNAGTPIMRPQLQFGTTTVTAIAFKTGFANSTVVSAIYTMPEYLYVSVSNSAVIRGIYLDGGTGTMTDNGTWTLPAPAGGIGVDSLGKFLYATNPSGSTFQGESIDAGTGDLVSIGDFGSSIVNPGVAFMNGNVLYMASQVSNVLQAEKMDASGFPSDVGTVGVQFNTVSISGDVNKQYLYAASDFPPEIHGFRLDGAGSPTPMSGSPFLAAGSIGGTVVSVSGDFLYASDSSGSSIHGYQITSGTGELLPLGMSPFGVGANPGRMAVDPSGNFLFILRPLWDLVEVYEIGSMGELIPASISATGTQPTAVAVDPSGKYLVVANSVSDDIWVYSINPASGALTQVGSPFPLGTFMPKDIVITAPAQ